MSQFFSSCGGNLEFNLELYQRWPFKTRDCSVISGLLSSCKGHLGILLEAWQGNREASQCEPVDQGPFPIATGILGFLSIFTRSQASAPFESLNSTCLSSCQRDVRSHVEMRQAASSFPRVSTVDSDTPSYCEMKDEPAFKSLQGNPAFFRDRASQCPFYLRKQTQGSLSHTYS